MENKRSYTLDVSGQMACFTRPEMKVERVSYEVIPPSAARAIFETIYWKPQIRWQVIQIEVLAPISFIHIRRCEVSSMASSKKNQIVVNNHRQLRSSLLLRDVHYRLTAELIMNEECLILNNEKRIDENFSLLNSLTKHSAIFERRAARGQCFTQPYLGCREFAADWRLISQEESVRPISEDRDLGTMFYDMDFSDPDNPQPKYYRAIMKQGVIHVPEL